MANLTLPLLGAPVTIIDVNGNIVTFPQSQISANGGTLLFDANGNLVLTEPATFGLIATGTVPATIAGAGTDAGTFWSVTAPAGGGSSGVQGGDGADITYTTGAAGASVSGGANGGDFTISLGAGSGTGRTGELIVNGGPIVMGVATSQLIPGATSFSIRNNANNADNLLVSNAGLVTVAAGVTITTADLTVTAGKINIGTAISQLVPGATSFSIRDNGNANDNFIITNAGAATLRQSLTINAGGITVVGSINLSVGGATPINLGSTNNTGAITIGNAASGIAKLTSGAQVILNATAGVLMAHVPVAVNATATLSAAQAASGYITSTSALATTMTLPTATALGTALGAVQGTIHYLYIDNTAGASTVTLALGAGFTLSAFGGSLTIVSGATGQACWKIMFSSATAATISRVA